MACSSGQGETMLYLVSASSDGTIVDVALAYNDATTAACGWSGSAAMDVTPGLHYSFILVPLTQTQAGWYPPPPPPDAPPPPQPPSPPPAPPPPPYSAGTCGALLPDTYFQGADLPDGYDVAGSPQECCDRCLALPECDGFSFTTDLDLGATYCSLKGTGWTALGLADTAWDGATSASRPSANQPPPARPPPPPSPPPPLLPLGSWDNPLVITALPYNGVNRTGVLSSFPVDVSGAAFTATVYRWTSSATAAGTLTAAACSAGLYETVVEVYSAPSTTGPLASEGQGFNANGPAACVTRTASTGYKGSVAAPVARSMVYYVLVYPLSDGDPTWQARLSLTLA
ncbi:hypothetical protein ABPG75_006663 [Micractinium tetrahymenae]